MAKRRADDGNDSQGFSIDQPVAVLTQAETWNLGVIAGVHRFLYSVLHNDSRRSLVVASEMIALESAPALGVDDRVLACRDGSRMHAGLVVSRMNDGFTIRWSDGSPPCEVPGGKIVRAPQSVADKMDAEMAQSARFPVGAKVAAEWRSYWYIAVVTGRSEGRYDVRYGDGDTGQLLADQMIATSQSPTLRPGDRVLACHNGPRMFFGVLAARTDNRFSVRWDTGGQVSDVSADEIALAPASAPPAPAPPAPVPAPPHSNGKSVDSTTLAIGQEVAAMWHSSWYIAVIMAQDQDRYTVRYGDGDTGVLSAQQMIAVGSGPRLVRGDRVLACWNGPVMYFGTVLEPGDSQLMIQWEDGSPPSLVAANQVVHAPR